MSKLIKLISLTAVSSAIAASYYSYVCSNNGYYYRNASWRRVGDHVQGILDRKEDIATSHISSKPQTVVLRPMSETMKDLWNEQVRNTVDWVYSLGKH